MVHTMNYTFWPNPARGLGSPADVFPLDNTLEMLDILRSVGRSVGETVGWLPGFLVGCFCLVSWSVFARPHQIHGFCSRGSTSRHRKRYVVS